MTLTLLLKSKSANTDFFLKLMGYQMHKTRARLDPGFSPTAFFLATVTGIEVAETVTSFLTFSSDFEDTY